MYEMRAEVAMKRVNKEQQTHNHLRKRVTKACDSCRTKKIKCDGQEPCGNCFKYQCACAYTHVVKKRHAPSTRVSNRKLLSDLSSRISTLESLLVGIRDSIESRPAVGSITEDEKSISEEAEEGPSSTDSNSPSSDSEDSCASAGSPVSMVSILDSLQHESINKGVSGDLMENSIVVGERSDSTGISNRKSIDIGDEAPFHASASATTFQSKPEGYVGAHSVFSLLSRGGLRWLQRKLQGKTDAILPVMQVRNMVIQSNQSCLNILLDRVPSSTPEFRFPPPAACEVLFKVFLEQIIHVARLAFEPDCLELFDKFRTSPQSLNRSEEMFLLSILLLSTIYMCHVEEEGTGICNWKELHIVLLVKTMRLFQQTVLCFMDDSLKYIQGVALFCWYLENSPIPYQVYATLTAAIRVAQEVGLHDRETYRNIADPVDLSRRKTIWFGLYRYDRCISIRTGKPPLIHDHDMTSLNDWDLYKEMASMLNIEDLQNTELGPDTDKAWIEKFDENLAQLSSKSLEGLSFTLKYFFFKLAQYSGRSYQYLLSSNAIEKNDDKVRKGLIIKLSRELEEWRNLLPPSLRVYEDVDTLPQLLETLRSYPQGPSYPGSLQYKKVTPESIYYQILALNMEYYLNLMYTNCVVRKNPWYENPDTPSRPAKDCPALDRCAFASRSLLKLCQLVLDTKAQYHFLLADVVYAFFSAFLNLFWRCLEFPLLARDDLLLMCSLMSSLVQEVSSHWTSYTMKWSTVSFTCLNLLKVALVHYNERCEDPNTKIDLLPIGAQLNIIQQHLLMQSKDMAVAMLAENNQNGAPLTGANVNGTQFNMPANPNITARDPLSEPKISDIPSSWFGFGDLGVAPFVPADEATSGMPPASTDQPSEFLGLGTAEDLLFDWHDFEFDEFGPSESSSLAPYFRF